jgi:hypothetical protein
MNNLFTFDLWLLSLTIALAAAGLCLLVRAWRLALYLAALIVASVLGCTVILWSDSNLQLTDVNVVSRLVGTVALTAVAITPLALQRAWDAGDGPSREVAVRRPPVWQAAFAWGLVVAAAIAYPATLLAAGGARFPNASDCVHAPSGSGSVLVVFGHAASYDDALRLRSRAVALGTKPIRLAQDGCGRIRVSVAAASSAEGEETVRRARTAGLSAALEAEPST